MLSLILKKINHFKYKLKFNGFHQEAQCKAENWHKWLIVNRITFFNQHNLQRNNIIIKTRSKFKIVSIKNETIILVIILEGWNNNI